ncbi:hypothetical protein A2U01_0067985, partial [Trifolium medium]|nr:hypothetical protein [Trifolium medium]
MLLLLPVELQAPSMEFCLFSREGRR